MTSSTQRLLGSLPPVERRPEHELDHLLFFVIKPTGCTNFTNLFWHETLRVGRRKTAQNSIEVDAETKESTRKTEEKLDEWNKEGHERKKPK